MAENDDVQPDEGGQQTEGGALRRQLTEALAENKRLAEENTGYKRRDAFREAGIDISEGVGQLLAKTYDGDLEADAIKAFAQEYGIDPGETQQVTKVAEAGQTQQRMDALRQQSQPDGAGTRLSAKEFLELNTNDPAAAREKWEAGMVDVPPHLAQQLAANGRGT